MILGETLQEHGKKVLEEIMEAGADCAEKLGATPEDMDLLMKKQVPSNKAGQCVVACVNKKFGLQKEDGTINKGYKMANMEAVKAIDEDVYNKMTSIWNDCGENVVQASDECDTGLNLVKCMKESGEKLGLTKEVMGF
ncbi:putative pheromone binding protein [Trypoxylus dichotomus]